MAIRPRPLERELVRGIRDALGALRITLWRRNTGAVMASYHDKPRLIQFSQPGQADLWGIGPDGRHWEVECKRPGMRPNFDQLSWLRHCSKLGAVAFWADSIETASNIAAAMLEGGEVYWYENGDFDIRVADLE